MSSLVYLEALDQPLRGASERRARHHHHTSERRPRARGRHRRTTRGPRPKQRQRRGAASAGERRAARRPRGASLVGGRVQGSTAATRCSGEPDHSTSSPTNPSSLPKTLVERSTVPSGIALPRSARAHGRDRAPSLRARARTHQRTEVEPCVAAHRADGHASVGVPRAEPRVGRARPPSERRAPPARAALDRPAPGRASSSRSGRRRVSRAGRRTASAERRETARRPPWDPRPL